MNIKTYKKKTRGFLLEKITMARITFLLGLMVCVLAGQIMSFPMNSSYAATGNLLTTANTWSGNSADNGATTTVGVDGWYNVTVSGASGTPGTYSYDNQTGTLRYSPGSSGLGGKLTVRAYLKQGDVLSASILNGGTAGSPGAPALYGTGGGAGGAGGAAVLIQKNNIPIVGAAGGSGGGGGGDNGGGASAPSVSQIYNAYFGPGNGGGGGRGGNGNGGLGGKGTTLSYLIQQGGGAGGIVGSYGGAAGGTTSNLVRDCYVVSQPNASSTLTFSVSYHSSETSTAYNTGVMALPTKTGLNVNTSVSTLYKAPATKTYTIRGQASSADVVTAKIDLAAGDIIDINVVGNALYVLIEGNKIIEISGSPGGTMLSTVPNPLSLGNSYVDGSYLYGMAYDKTTKPAGVLVTITAEQSDPQIGIDELKAQNTQILNKLNSTATVIPTFTVIKGKPFDFLASGYSGATSGTVGAITILYTDVSQSAIRVMGVTESSEKIEINGKMYIFNVVEEPNSGNITAIFN